MEDDYTCPKCGAGYKMIYSEDPTLKPTDHLPDHCIWCGYCIHLDRDKEANITAIKARLIDRINKARAARLN